MAERGDRILHKAPRTGGFAKSYPPAPARPSAPDDATVATDAVDRFIAEVIRRQPWKGLADFEADELHALRDRAVEGAVGVSEGHIVGPSGRRLPLS